MKDQTKNIHDHNVATFISTPPILTDTPKHPRPIDVTPELVVHENIPTIHTHWVANQQNIAIFQGSLPENH